MTKREGKKKVLIAIIVMGLLLSGFTVIAGAYFVGSSESDVYHYPSCYHVDKIKQENLIYFDTPEDAIAAGYRPCKVCKPPTKSSPTPTSTPSPSPAPSPSPIPSPTPTPTPTPSLINWIEKANTPVAGGYGEAVVSADDYIYIARCMYASSTPYFWRYNLTANSFDTMNTSGLPTGAFRSGTSLTWDNGSYIYSLLGGRYSDKDRCLFYRYNIQNDSWEQLNDTPYPQGAGNAITWSGYDDQLYAFLGSGKLGTFFARYNISNSSWNTTLPFNWTSTDDGASLAWTGGEYLYALRGEYDETVPNGVFARYCIPNGPWVDMSPMPESEGVGDGASLLWTEEYPDYIFALGGGSCLEDPGYNFYCYNISSNEWEQLESIPCPVGYYVGNRLGFAKGHIYYWQGAPTAEKWICGGDAFFMFETTPLRVITGSISVTSDPSGAMIYLDNKREGKTPRTITDVLPGTLTIKLILDDYEDWSKEVQVTADETTPVHATLTPTTCSIRVTSDPSGATVCLDGDDWYPYETPCTITGVDPGDGHSLKITLKGYQDWLDNNVQVAIGETTPIHATLTPIPTTHIIINEVEANPPGEDSGNEWVEVYNPTSVDVDLSGWTLKTTHGRIGKVDLYGTIEAKGYCVFVHKRGIQWLDNEGDSIILRDNSGVKIDEVAFTDRENDDYTWQRYTNGEDSWKFRWKTKGYSNGG